MEVIQNDVGRFYVIEGVSYPSMTTVLGLASKGHIEAWQKRVGMEAAKAKMEYACERGNTIHAMAEDYLKTGTYDKSDIFNAMLFKPVKKWLDDNIEEVVAIEIPLWSHKFKIAGRCDLIARLKSGVTKVIDFKTAEKAKPVEWISNYLMQGAGYIYCYNEMNGTNLEEFEIVMVDESSFNITTYCGKSKDYLLELAKLRRQFKDIFQI
jgi:hypothetical protein